MPKKKTEIMDPVDPGTRTPRVSVVDRRIAHPFGSPSVPITLKEGGPWEIRIVDSQLRSGRIHDMRHQKGWEFVEPREIDGTPDEYGLRVVDGRLVRGENGREVLMKMLKSDYDKIMQAKAALNLKGLGKQATREAAAQATAQAFGSEAGDRVYGSVKIGNEHVPVIDVTTTRGPSAELEGVEIP